MILSFRLLFFGLCVFGVVALLFTYFGRCCQWSLRVGGCSPLSRYARSTRAPVSFPCLVWPSRRPVLALLAEAPSCVILSVSLLAHKLTLRSHTPICTHFTRVPTASGSHAQRQFTLLRCHQYFPPRRRLESFHPCTNGSGETSEVTLRVPTPLLPLPAA